MSSTVRTKGLAFLSILALLFGSSLASFGFGQIPDNVSGYVDVRPSAHMFWWLYGGTNLYVEREQLPLVMWLQVGNQNRFINFDLLFHIN